MNWKSRGQSPPRIPPLRSPPARHRPPHTSWECFTFRSQSELLSDEHTNNTSHSAWSELCAEQIPEPTAPEKGHRPVCGARLKSIRSDPIPMAGSTSPELPSDLHEVLAASNHYEALRVEPGPELTDQAQYCLLKCLGF